MKKIKLLLVSILTFGILGISQVNVFAAGAGISAPSSAYVGDNVTITVSVSNAITVDLTASVSGCGTGGTIRLVEGNMSGEPKTFSKSITVKPTTTGTISVSVDGSSNAVFAGGAFDSVGGSKSISVSNRPVASPSAPAAPKPSTPSAPVTPKNTENKLSSLTISAGELNPAFNENTTSYTVDLTNETEKVTVNAKAKDSKATVQGTGEKTLAIGENNFVVTCVAENGAKKSYTISVNVVEKPTVFLNVGDKELGIINNYGRIETPKNFVPQELQIGDKIVNSLFNETLNMTLVCLQNEDGSVQFHMYDTEEKEVTGLYQPITIDGKEFYIVDNSDAKVGELEATKVKIGEVELQGWKHPDANHKDYTLVYLMNSEGKKVLYSYEATEGTLQKYTENVVEPDYTMYYIAAIAVLAVSSIGLGVMHLSFKKKTREYYERRDARNQYEEENDEE